MLHPKINCALDQRSRICSLVIAPVSTERVVWRCMDLLGGRVLNSLIVLDIRLDDENHPPVLGRMDADFPQLLSQLQVLRLMVDSDETADLGPTLAVCQHHLRELCVTYNRLTSLQSLIVSPGGVDFRSSLRTVDFSWCRQLNSLDGIEHLTQLEWFSARDTAVTSLRPLKGCTALRKVDVCWSPKIETLDGLEGHEYLEEVNVSYTSVSSVVTLAECRALKVLDLTMCFELQTLSGLEFHPRLQQVTASYTNVKTLLELQSCTGLRKVVFRCCCKLQSIDGLQNHPHLEEVVLCETLVASLSPLLQGCGELKSLDIRFCPALSDGHGHECLEKLQLK